MDDNFNVCLNFMLAQEGGFSDNPKDPGGATYKGITLNSLRDYLRAPNTPVAVLRGLDDVTIAKFYRGRFWSEMQCGVLPAGLDLMVFDHGVNVGAARPVPMLQDILGVDDDGMIGPLTLAAIATRRPSSLISELRGAQETYYRGLKNFPAFGHGWLNRLARRYTKSVQLTQAPPPATAAAA